MATNWEKVFDPDYRSGLPAPKFTLSPEQLEESLQDEFETEYIEHYTSGEILPSEQLGLIPEPMKPRPRRSEKAPTLRDRG